MPRPRVPLSQRQRAVVACHLCRVSKKRCSATVPCTNCVNRGRADSCYLSYDTHRASNRAASAISSTPIRRRAFSNNELDARPAHAGHISGNRRFSNSSSQLDNDRQMDMSAEMDININAERPEIPDSLPLESQKQHGPQSRMLCNLQGDQVYIGGAASLAFLQLIRDTVAEHIGPSQFSHNNKCGNMLEMESPQSYQHCSFIPAAQLDINQKLVYAHAYYAASAGFLDVLPISEVEQILREMESTNDCNVHPCKMATVNLVVAIGAQCSKTTPTTHQVALDFFCQAQKHAFARMLEDPDIDLVRAFTLMAYYMLGACRRNAAFMYLGVATRAAVTLGLHRRDSYATVDDQRRLRTWMSLCVLDTVVSSILGRPSATSSLCSDIYSSFIGNPLSYEDDHAAACLAASFSIRPIINEIVDELYEKKACSTAVAERLLEDLNQWSERLPDSLRNSSIPSADASGMQKLIIGNVHVSCLYYFTLTLITRPFLVLTIVDEPAVESQSNTDIPSQDDLTNRRLASACLDAALYLVQTCWDVYKSDTLLCNMCILKALVFAAGLILGFHLFAEREVDYEIETSFSKARMILDMLSAQSPQAAHYFEILTMLSKAIAKQRTQQAASRDRSRYVKRLFTLDGANVEDEAEVEADSMNILASLAASADTNTGSAPVNERAGGNWRDMVEQIQSGLDEGLSLRWDSLDLSLWDNFPFTSLES